MGTQVAGNLVQVAVLVNSRQLQVHRRPGDGMAFVEAFLGKPYTILVTPIHIGRYEIVSSVDGKNTLKNEAAHPVKNQGMVINSPWEITGFRINDRETAEFVFSDPFQSVAAQTTGSTSHTGVIGIAVYAEKQQFLPLQGSPLGGQMRGWEESATLSPKGVDPSDAGTAAGRVRFDAVGHTTFERMSPLPMEMIVIQYRTRQWLLEHGIITPADPTPWPGYNPDDTGYGFLAK